ncbi:MAG: phosphonoacetaldehyde hydrolase [Alphaproteobacteria bacterium]|nr:phosphonoacetaldehyde hydrolase [Alphaproteobacteria bacterium]
MRETERPGTIRAAGAEGAGTSPYRGPLKAVVFDWAGTLVDFGSLAPMGVFVDVFARFGLEITISEARAFMGLPKRDHIKGLLELPRIAEAFRARYGRPPAEDDIDEIYSVFLPANVAAIPANSGIVPGAADIITRLRERGMKIGSTTGYTREIMDVMLPLAARQGVHVESLVCAGDLAWGRPTPMMMYRTFLELGVWPAAAVVKVDDTPVGIEEGCAAGAWSIGVAVSGNGFGLSKADADALAPDAFAERRAAAAEALTAAGAHLVIDTVADLMPVLAAIEARLDTGRGPEWGPLES